MTVNLGKIFGTGEEIREFQTDPQIIGNRLVGIEVELEGMKNIGQLFRNQQHPMLHWTLTCDGSLRNAGVEFVLSQPLGGKDVLSALSKLDSLISDYSEQIGSPSFSERTSVHVHIDMRSESFSTLTHFIALFLIFEKTLFRTFGEGRDTNNYCQPVSSGGLLDTVSKMVDATQKREGNSPIYHGVKGSSKYNALNIRSLYGLGSVEFRLHRGEWKSEKLLLWINTLLSLADYASKNELDFDKFSGNISMMGLDEFLISIFTEGYGIIEALAYPEMWGDLLCGIRHAQDMLLLNPSVSSSEKLNRYGKKRATKGGATLLEGFCLKQQIDYEGDS